MFQIMETETSLSETALDNAQKHITQLILPEWIKPKPSQTPFAAFDKSRTNMADSSDDSDTANDSAFPLQNLPSTSFKIYPY